MSKIVITGGAGYIGTALTEELLNAGHSVVCVDRAFFGTDALADFLTNPCYSLVRDDVRTVDSAVFRGADAVIDLAAISNDPSCDLDPQVTKDINLNGAIRTAALAKRMGVPRYIFSSSCSVYGHGTNIRLTEESALAPVSLYAKYKIQAEEHVLNLASGDFCVTVLRNATVYGPSRRMRYDLLVNLMTAKAFHDRVIYVLGGGRQWRPNIHVVDVARAFNHVLNQPAERVAGEIFNVGSNDQNYRVVDIAHIVRNVLQNVSIEIVPDDPDKRTYNVSFDKITDKLGFRTVHTIPEAVAEINRRMINGTIWPFSDPRTRTLEYYMWLTKARDILDDVSINGKLFHLS